MSEDARGMPPADARIAVGVDIGGTNVKLGLVAADGRLVARRRFDYASLVSFEALADQLASHALAMQTEAGCRAAALGVAAPGHARPADGLMVDGTANVPLLHRQSLAAALRQRLGLPVATLNDGTAAALAELHFGAGRGWRRFVVLTFGTGVGGGVAIDGRVLTGDDGEPPELGAMVLEAPAGAPPRTLEHYACAGGFAAAYAQRGGSGAVTPQALFGLAAAGEARAVEAIDETCRRIAQALGTLINALNLNGCLLGGGIAAAGPALLEPVRRSLKDYTWPFLLARSCVELAATGSDAGLLGAAAFALQSPGSGASGGHAHAAAR
jgi:glucokinase